jgi:hypothetical protein
MKENQESYLGDYDFLQLLGSIWSDKLEKIEYICCKFYCFWINHQDKFFLYHLNLFKEQK